MNTRKNQNTEEQASLLSFPSGQEAPAPNGADQAPAAAPRAAAAPRVRKPSIFDDAEALIALTNAKLGEAQQVGSSELVYGRPKATWYFRAERNPAMLFRGAIWGDPDDRTAYFVSPNLWDLDDLEGALKPTLFAPYVTADGVHGIWPLNTTSGNTFNSTAMRILEESQSQWLRVWPVLGRQIYRRHFAARDYGEPKFLDMPILHQLREVFPDREISDEEHPVIARLRGLL